MSKKLLPFLLLVLLSLPVSKADAARFSGAYLLHLCEMEAQGGEKVRGGHAACQAYISAIVDYHNVLQSLKMAPDLKICISDEITPYELHKTVLNYLRNNSQHDDFVASPAVTMALFDKYPCK